MKERTYECEYRCLGSGTFRGDISIHIAEVCSETIPVAMIGACVPLSLTRETYRMSH